MNNKSIAIIVAIVVLSFLAICMVAVILTWKDPIEPPPENPYKDNGMFEILEIDRAQEGNVRKKMMAILTYNNGTDEAVINQIANNKDTNLKYVVLDKNAKGNLLVVPHNINGTITISKLIFDIGDTGKYKVGETVFTGQVFDNYGLLLKYDRPKEEKFEQKYKYAIKLEQDEEVATYWISDSDNESGVRAETVQYIRQDLEDRDHTEWMNKNGLTTSKKVDEEDTEE